ncbi:twin-arginine translocation pathway signal protein [Opitutaceae bacterium EW11]|nr:twin-arginine translocation pathway signal protein [Opitutaceae bacterium EW11]
MRTPFLPSTRREFLRYSASGIGLIAFSRFAPSFLVQSTLAAAPAPEKDRSVLVLVQLAGGNDGLNTLIPFEDADYHRLRPTLALRKTDVLPVGQNQAFHPSMTELQGLVHDGKLAVIQNVGYPNPNRSHFRSTDIWETGSESDQVVSTGWIGRYLDNCCSGAPVGHDPLAVHVGNETPEVFLSQQVHPTFGVNPYLLGRKDRSRNQALLEQLLQQPSTPENDNASFLKATMMDALVTERRVQGILGAYQAGTTYPGTPFAHSLEGVAALIAADLPTRVYFVSLSGFDTHANQANNHRNLLKTLSEGLAAFQKDLEAHKLGERVLTMTFSEFGRRPMENQSQGTDHGTAAPLFVMGSAVKGGLHGEAPKLNLARNQDLTFSTDFRQIYATVLDRWLDCPAEKVLGRSFEPVAFL